MKKVTPLFLLTPLLFVLTGCPFDSSYSIDHTPQQNIDETFIGTWNGYLKTPSINNYFVEKPIKLIFEKITETEYQFYITGYAGNLNHQKFLDTDTIQGTGFISVVAGRRLINSLINGRYYVAEIQQSKSAMSIKFLAENFTAKFIRSSRDLRNALNFHYKTMATASYDNSLEFTRLQKE